MIQSVRFPILFVAFHLFAQPGFSAGIPPYGGTIFVDADIITDSDPTTYQSLTPIGQGTRLMFDRRIEAFANFNAFLFTATFSDGASVEVQVNPEFGNVNDAKAAAEKFLPAIGRIPRILRTSLKTIWIHKGLKPFGGGNNNLLIHTEQGDDYINNGILEETFVHEAAHTSLDPFYANAPGWIAAQVADDNFISTYAQDHPTREDVAETFLLSWAVVFRSDRLSQATINIVNATVPNRTQYFRDFVFNADPVADALRAAQVRSINNKIRKTKRKIRTARRAKRVKRTKSLKKQLQRFRRKLRNL